MDPTTWANSLNPEQKGYLAGVLDSDGSIGFYTSWRKDRVKKTSRYRGGGFKCDPRIQFFNTYKPMLEYIYKLTQSGSLRKVIRKRETQKTHWILCITNKQCYTLLKVLEPFLIRKRPQADLLCKYYELRANKPYNSRIEGEEMEMIAQMKKLNNGVNFD